MVGDDDERQASPCARQAGLAARRASRAATGGAGRLRRVRPLLRAYRAEVDESAGHHPRRARCRVGGALPRAAQARGGQGPRRDHDRPPRCRNVPPRRSRRRPAARGSHHRPGRQRCRRCPRRRSGRQGGDLRHLLRHVSRRGSRCAPPGSGARDGSRFAGAVGSRHRRRPPRHPASAVGRRRSRGRGIGTQGATTGRRRGAHPRGRSSSPRRSTASPDRAAGSPTRSTAAWPTRVVDRCSIRRRGFCSTARRRTATNRTWSGGSGSANSTTARCPTASRSTRRSHSASSPRSHGIRGRTLRSHRGDAEVQLADGRHLRWPRSHHSAGDRRGNRFTDSRFGSRRVGDRRPQRDRRPRARRVGDRRGALRRENPWAARPREGAGREAGRMGIRLLVGAIGAAAIVESALPAAIPRMVQRATS